ncbi:MAG: ABC transporter ATP-binding protein [Candidatus Bathyarchaeia archaeon]|nr:ABC transporter ATP-binding protein [Candidatus Bathyarchaeota archaeon]
MSRILIKNLRYRYPVSKTDVLKGMSLTIPEGKVTAILGPNGSGKSTLFKVLIKVLSPYEGDIYVGGNDLRDLDIDALSKIISWVPQEEDLLFPYTVLEYVLLGRTPHLGFFNMPSRKDMEIVHEVLMQLRLSGIVHRKIPTLSGGEKKLVSIARALVQETDIIILDEPTAHLDMGNKARVLGIIKGMAESGKTIIFSTHDPNEAFLIANNVAIVNDGKLISEGPPGTVITEELLEKVYGVKVTVQRADNGQVLVGIHPNIFKSL